MLGLLVAGFAIFIAFLYFRRRNKNRLKNKKIEVKWLGPGDSSTEDSGIEAFQINIADEVLDDLKWRLENLLPFQKPLEGVKQHYGMNTNLLREIVNFWKTEYNWKEREQFLNKYLQYKVNIQGLKIHFIHVKPDEIEGIKRLPLLLLHGWPGSVREFYEIIPILTTPQPGRDFVFEIIAPSLPGFGFSDAAVRSGLSVSQIAVVFKNLMDRMGYDKYYIQGGDWGGAICASMADLFPERIIGIHSNMLSVSKPIYNLIMLIATYFPPLRNRLLTKLEAEKCLPIWKSWIPNLLESGYLHIQASKPDTIGVALRESPVGLAAYILEKFTTWTNPNWKDLEDGGLTKKYNYTKLLDNVMIYWVTRSITTSMRLYAEEFALTNRASRPNVSRCLVPTGYTRFEYELGFTPEFVLKTKYKNLVHLRDHRDVGHFPAFEVPEVLAFEIYDFVGKVEKL